MCGARTRGREEAKERETGVKRGVKRGERKRGREEAALAVRIPRSAAALLLYLMLYLESKISGSESAAFKDLCSQQT